MALDIEVVENDSVGGEETLSRLGRPEPDLLPLAAPGRLMRHLRPVV